MAGYIFTAHPDRNARGYSTACFKVEERPEGYLSSEDLVSLDTDPPNRPPCVIEINSKGEIRRMVWRVW